MPFYLPIMPVSPTGHQLKLIGDIFKEYKNINFQVKCYGSDQSSSCEMLQFSGKYIKVLIFLDQLRSGSGRNKAPRYHHYKRFKMGQKY